MLDKNKIKCIFYDFDGVMTDNCVWIDEDGKESVSVNRSDGYAIARIKDWGIRQVIISTETNPVVKRRAEKLKLEIVSGVADKAEVMKKYCEAHGIELEETVFVGNDLNDISAMRIAGIKAAPADAEKEILEIADWISERKGGFGVIRDLYRTLNIER